MKVRRLDKLPKRQVTVDDILDRSDVVDAIQDVLDERDNIDEFIGITVTDGSVCWRISSMSVARLDYLLDVVKNCILKDDK